MASDNSSHHHVPSRPKTQLPTEVLLAIFGHLPFSDYLPLLVTSTRLRGIALSSLCERFTSLAERNQSALPECDILCTTAEVRPGPQLVLTCKLQGLSPFLRGEDKAAPMWDPLKRKWRLVPFGKRVLDLTTGDALPYSSALIAQSSTSEVAFLANLPSHFCASLFLLRNLGRRGLISIEPLVVSAGRHHLRSSNGMIQLVVRLQPSSQQGMLMKCMLEEVWVSSGTLLVDMACTPEGDIVGIDRESSPNPLDVGPYVLGNQGKEASQCWQPAGLECSSWWNQADA